MTITTLELITAMMATVMPLMMLELIDSMK